MATPKQIETLHAIAAGSVHMTNFGYSAFRIVGANPSVVGKCVSLGWAKWPKGPIGEQTCELTAEGHSVAGTTPF